MLYHIVFLVNLLGDQIFSNCFHVDGLRDLAWVFLSPVVENFSE